MDLYADNILEHYRNPCNTGTLQGADITHEEKNWSCGDAVTVHLRIENACIREMRWEGTGCAISQAAMSLLSERLEGMETATVIAMEQEDMYALLGIPIGPRRLQCAMIGLHAVQNAIRTHQRTPLRTLAETVKIEAE